MGTISTLARWVSSRTQRSTVDPFSALEVQMALTRVERLIAGSEGVYLDRFDGGLGQARHWGADHGQSTRSPYSRLWPQPGCLQQFSKDRCGHLAVGGGGQLIDHVHDLGCLVARHVRSAPGD